MPNKSINKNTPNANGDSSDIAHLKSNCVSRPDPKTNAPISRIVVVSETQSQSSTSESTNNSTSSSNNNESNQ